MSCGVRRDAPKPTASGPTWEQRLSSRHPEGDVAARVAGGVKHAHLVAPKGEGVPVAHLLINTYGLARGG